MKRHDNDFAMAWNVISWKVKECHGMAWKGMAMAWHGKERHAITWYGKA
jgi:hypothetical protein